MESPFDKIQRDISASMFVRPSDVSIKVDSLDNFVNALSERIDLVPADKPIKGAEFCGVKVTENDHISRGLAVIMQGNEIVNIIRYAS